MKAFPRGRVAVESPDIDSLTLVNPLPAWTRVYVGPWLALYPLAYYAWINYDTYIKSIGSSLSLSSSSSWISNDDDGMSRASRVCSKLNPPSLSLS